MELPVVGGIVNFFTTAFAAVLIGFVAYRILVAFGADNEMAIWKAVFWGFIAYGFIVMGTEIFDTLFHRVWEQIISQ